MTSNNKKSIPFYLPVTRTDLKVYFPFILLMIISIWGTYAFTYVESKKPQQLAFRWFLIPAISISAFYAYYSVVKRSLIRQLWKKLLLIISFEVVFSVLLLLSCRSVIILWNGHIGTQSFYRVTGIVKTIEYPKSKGVLSTYTTSVLMNTTDSILSFDITGKEYVIGETFDKQMKIGSLGFLYSKN